MTFNIRYDKPDPGDRAWSVRCRSVLKLIEQHQPDILCTQECLPHQLVELLVGLPGYGVVGRDRRGSGKDEYCAILYRHERFERVGHGNFSLAPSYLPRIATWLILRDRELGTEIAAINTHLDHENADARLESAELILNEFGVLWHAHRPIVITGDFNARPGSPARVRLGRPLRDSVAEMQGDRLTYKHWSGDPHVSIDTVFYSGELSLKSVVVDRSEPLGVRPSDHYPVVADLEVNT